MCSSEIEFKSQHSVVAITWIVNASSWWATSVEIERSSPHNSKKKRSSLGVPQPQVLQKTQKMIWEFSYPRYLFLFCCQVYFVVLMLEAFRCLHKFSYSIGSMGLVYLPTWMVDFYGINVSKYTVRPIDPTVDGWNLAPPGMYETL